MKGLLYRASWRFYLRHPWQLGLAVLGIGLGVAVYVGIGLANDSAARAFDVAATRVRGSVTHRLLPISGTLDEALYRDLVLNDGIATAAPVLEAETGIASRPGLRARLVGIDPIQQAVPRPARSVSSADADFARLLVEPGTVLLPAALATELGVARGATLTLLIAGRNVETRVIGVVPDTAAPGDDDALIVADIATAQELLGAAGRLSRIDLELSEAQARAFGEKDIPNTLLIPTEAESGTFRQLTAAFRTNLTALGLLALVVGMFLIYGTMTFAVLQRTATIGILRALGVSRAEVMTSIGAEAVVIAVVATAFGLALGHGLAIGLVGLVLQTIGDLSFGSAVAGASPSPWLYVQGAALGIGATLLAAAKPALDATRIEPTAALRRAVLERRAHVATRRAALTALVLLALSAAVLALCVVVHLVTIIYAVRGGLPAAEILERTRGNTGWFAFYSAFVLAVTGHVPIGLRSICLEWLHWRGRSCDFALVLFAALLAWTGMRAVLGVFA